jgi:hypothetical protein
LLIRFLLFLVPPVLLALTAAIDLPARLRVPRAVGTPISALVLAALVAVTAAPVLAGARVFAEPMTVTETRGIFQAVARDLRPGDGVALHNAAVATYQYYGQPLGLPRDAVVSMQRRPRCEDSAQLAQLGGFDRVWVIFGHELSIEPDAVAVYRSRLDALGTVVRTITADGGAAAILYDPTRPPDTPAQPLPPFRPRLCLVITR